MRGDNMHEYNDNILRLRNKVNDAFRKKKTADNAHLREAFDDTKVKVNDTRIADHAPYLLEAAYHPADGMGMGVSIKDIGKYPATDEASMTIDWAGTARHAFMDGVSDPQSKIRNFLDWFYRGDITAAKHHFQVRRTYNCLYDRTVNCRRSS
jgi:hypothetical protein